MTQIETTIIQLCKTLLDRLEAAEARIATLETALEIRGGKREPAPAAESPRVRTRTRTLRTYADYLKIHALANEGMGDKEIAASLNMPYTTVRKYLRLSESEVEKLKAKYQEPEKAEQEYTIPDLPLSPEPYGSRGWQEWPMEYRIKARESQTSDGWPLYAPCHPTAHVTVEYANGEVEKERSASRLDWSDGGGIQRFYVHVDSVPF